VISYVLLWTYLEEHDGRSVYLLVYIYMQ